MAYYNNNRYGKKSYYGKKRKSSYTKAEKIAFELGQKQRVAQSINSGKTDNRVYESYCKGYQGTPNNGRKKPLFAD